MTILFFQFPFAARLNLDRNLNLFRELVQPQGRNHADHGIAEQRFYKAVQFYLLAVNMNTNGLDFLFH
mgnify:CR=1 FL=1